MFWTGSDSAAACAASLPARGLCKTPQIRALRVPVDLAGLERSTPSLMDALSVRRACEPRTSLARLSVREKLQDWRMPNYRTLHGFSVWAHLGSNQGPLA